MKHCPQCRKTYDDAAILCQYDGSPLLARINLSDPYTDTLIKPKLEPDTQSEVSTKALTDIQSRPSSGSRLNNLPVQLTPLIGREAEIMAVDNLMRREDVRLLTLTGPGGTGKTRLSLQVAADLFGEFTDGVFFVALAPISDPQLVASAIAQTLGTKETGSISLVESIKEYLRGKQVLLALDNFEQVISAASLVTELLMASSRLKVLVTSREPLHIRGEHEFAVPPLALPNLKQLPPPDTLTQFAAVELFVQRASAVKTDFILTSENMLSVAEICTRLDGLPLAIELAAARIKVLSPQAILARLESRLKLLVSGARDLPERQQTMRGAINWSYDLLEEDEKKLLNRLGVFAGGFTLDEAEAVANSEEDLSVGILDGVASLVDKSLLSRREESSGEARFRILEVVREFALEALESSGEAGEIKRRHAGFYASLAEAAEPELRSEKAAQWLETLEQEHDNMRSAIVWSLENEPQTALRIVGAIRSFWVRRGYLSEGSKWARQALERTHNGDPKLRAKAYLGLGVFSRFQGDLKAAEQFNEESLRLTLQTGDKYWISVALGDLGLVKFMQGDLIRGKALMEESLAIARELNNRKLVSIRLTGLGEIAREQEDYEAAQKYYKEALAIAREESSKYLIPIFTFNLASVACLLGDYQSVISNALESLTASEELGDKISIGDALNIFGALAVKGGEVEKAARLWGAAQAIHDAIGFKLEKVDRDFNDRHIAEARAAIGDEMFERVFKEGQSMRLKNVITLAREMG